MILNVVNFITFCCAVFALWSSWHVYRLVKTKSVMFLSIAVAYICGVRVAVSVGQAMSSQHWIPAHSSYLLIPFYPLLALGFYLLYRSLRKMLVEGDMRLVIDDLEAGKVHLEECIGAQEEEVAALALATKADLEELQRQIEAMHAAAEARKLVIYLKKLD